MKRTLLFLTLLALSPAVLASTSDIFTPVNQDLSIFYLGTLFGNVSTSLPVSSSVTIIGEMFSIFNEVALAVGIILVIYSVVVGTMNTAHKGEPWGEKWSTMWMPVRTAGGIALLLPKANGYCLVQVLVMWIAVQGIGAADTVWNKAVDYIAGGGTFYVGDAQNDESLALNTAYESYSTVFKNLVCVQAQNSSNAVQTSGVYGWSMFYDPDNPGEEPSLRFGYTDGDNGAGDECGSIKMINASRYGDVFMELADNLARSGLIKKAVNHNLEPNDYNDLKIPLVAFVNEMKSNTPVSASHASSFDSYKQYGWILAGAYYRMFAAEHAAQKTNIDYPTQGTDAQDREQTAYKDDLDYADNFLQDAQTHVASSDAASQNVAASILDGLSNVSDTNSDFPKWIKKLKIDKAFKEMAKPVFNAIDSIGARGNIDPFSQAIEFGQDMMKFAAKIIAILTAANVVLGLATKWCAGKSSTGVFLTPIQDLLNVVGIGVGSLLYVQGASLAIYLPLIPFIIFFMSSLGWLLSVFEAMVAAPLVAIGLIWPEAGQNEVLGKADPAVMLFLNLFLRPVLMIFGLIGGLLLVWVGFTLFSIGFRYMFGAHYVGYEPMFGWVAMGMIYIMVLIQIAQKCFSLIHHVPDRVLSWIGDHTQGLGDSGAGEAMQQARSGTQTGGELGFSAGTQVAKTGGKAGEFGGNLLGGASGTGDPNVKFWR